MAGEKRSSKKAAMESSFGKKAKMAAGTASSTITVTVEPQLLECGNCFGPLAPPLFQCSKGHMTCSECCAEYHYVCQVCPEHEPAIRCRAMEHVLDGLTVPCPFREHGCTRMIPYAERPHHGASCPHAPCYCPIAGCGAYAGMSLQDHVEQEHPVVPRTRVGAGCLCPLRIRDGEAARLVCLGDDRAAFLVVVDRSVPSGRALSVVHLMEEEPFEEDFKYKIEVYSRSGILSLAGDTKSVGRLTRPYQATASLFVPDAMWEDAPVYIELK